MSPPSRTKKRTAEVAPAKVARLEELVLYNSKLRFCAEQLQNLNYLFHGRLERKPDREFEKSSILARSVAERLVQRLVCCAGMRDARFSSKFLVDSGASSCQNLEYIVRLDGLSTPCLYKGDEAPKYCIIENDPDYPAGYARIRLNGATLKAWSEFANSAGYLRRDRVQARMVELLSGAALGGTPPDSALQIDESTLCGAPGKIVDPATLQRVLRLPADHQVFYGPSGNVPRFPDPRDFRLAIVDEPEGILVRVEFLSPALASVAVRARLLLGVGADVWPSTTDFPARVPLGHPDCLLYCKAAQTGCYLVGYGVQSSAWQVRLPAAEYTVLNHFGPNSTVSTVLDVLCATLEELHAPRKLRTSHEILNRYNMRTALLRELERDQGGPSALLVSWSPLYLSTLVLKILDKLILSLRDQRQPNYFFAGANLLVNPGHLCEDDFMLEAEKVQTHLLRLFDESLMSTKGNRGFNEMMIAQNTEMLLLNKWKEIVGGLLPPSVVKKRRWCFARSTEGVCGKYSRRQLEYIGLLLGHMLDVKRASEEPWQPEDFPDDPLEDVVYLLVAIIEQARDQFLNDHHPHKNKNKFKARFDASTTKLVEALRKDKQCRSLDLQDDVVLVRTVLEWLYRGLGQDKKTWGPVLDPYLNALFHASHAASWHVDFIRKLQRDDELEALGKFAALVNEGRITPAQGLLDAVAKNWNWAKEMLKQVEGGNLRLVFAPERGKVFRHILSLSSRKKEDGDGSKTLRSSRVKDGDCKRMTLPSRSYFNTILKQGRPEDHQELPRHDVLKTSSPLTHILQQTHRRGDHRCCGDILQALLSIQKLNVLQDVSSHLPEGDRAELLETVRRLTDARGRRTLAKRWSTSLPQPAGGRLESRQRNPEVQKYTPREESAGVPLAEAGKGAERAAAGTLIGSCRAARVREDGGAVDLRGKFRVGAAARGRDAGRS